LAERLACFLLALALVGAVFFFLDFLAMC
jgi:hypothetical protein